MAGIPAFTKTTHTGFMQVALNNPTYTRLAMAHPSCYLLQRVREDGAPGGSRPHLQRSADLVPTILDLVRSRKTTRFAQTRLIFCCSGCPAYCGKGGFSHATELKALNTLKRHSLLSYPPNPLVGLRRPLRQSSV
jgi:hypothetical protein